MKTKFENIHTGSETSTVQTISKNTNQPNTLWTQLAFDFLTQQNFKMKTRTIFSLIIAAFIALSFNQLEAQTTTYQSKYFNFPEEDYDIEAIVSTPDGGTVFTGTRTKRDYYNRDIVDWSGIYVTRTDGTGRANWMKYYTPNYSEACYFTPTTIVNGIDGGFVIGGIFTNCLDVYAGMFILKVSEDGYMDYFKMHKKWDNYSSVLLKELKQDGNEGYVGIASVLQGETEDPIATLVIKIDGAGELQARNLFKNDDSDLEAKAIEVYPEGGYVLLVEDQHSYDGTYSTNPLVIKLNDQLIEEWNRYVSSGLDQVSAVDIAIGQATDILVTGNVNPYDDEKNLIYLLSLHPDGYTNWQNAFHWRECDVFMDGANEVKGLNVDEEGNIYIGGNAWPFLYEHEDGSFTSSVDAFVIRTSSHGLGQWLNFYGDEDDEMMNTMTAIHGEGFAFAGYTIDINPTQYSNNFTAWVTKADGTGSSDCDYRSNPLQSINHSFWTNIIGLDNEQEDFETLVGYSEVDVQTIIAYVCYQFLTTDWDEMPMIVNPNTDGELQQNTIEKQSSSAISPNPTDGKFNIRLADFFENEGSSNITILDTSGKIIFNQNIESIDTEFEMNHLAKGAYFVKIQSGEKLEQHKLIIH